MNASYKNECNIETSDTSNRVLFEVMPVPKALALLAIPTIISQLITLVYNLADAYFVGRTGNTYMIAAVSLVYPLFSMTAALSNLFGVGGSSLISRLLGMKQEEQARRVCVFSLYAEIGVSLLFSLMCLCFINPLLDILGASPESREYAKQYMVLVVVLGTVPTTLSTTMAHLLRSVGYAKNASFGLSMGAVFNIILDPLFMFVLLPQGQEVIGAALATLISNVIAAIYFVFMMGVLQKKTILSLSPKVGMPEKANIGAILSVGLPSALTALLYDMTNVFLNALMAGHGDHQLAALGIVLKAERLPLNVGMGLCHGMLPLVAYNYSAQNKRRMSEVIQTTRMVGVAISGFSILLYEIFAGSIIAIFINSLTGDFADVTATISYGITFLRRRCLAAPFAFMNFHITYSLQAIGDGKNTLFLAALRQCILYIPIIFLMNSLLGANGLVWTQTVTDIITLVIAFFVFQKAVNRI